MSEGFKSKLTGVTSTFTYLVWAPEVWGHGPDEHEEYDCDGDCDGYTVNRRNQVGRVEVEVEQINSGTAKTWQFKGGGDRALVKALIAAGFLDPDFLSTDKPEDGVEVDGDMDFTLYLHLAEDGFPLYQLERVENAQQVMEALSC